MSKTRVYFSAFYMDFYMDIVVASLYEDQQLRIAVSIVTSIRSAFVFWRLSFKRTICEHVCDMQLQIAGAILRVRVTFVNYRAYISALYSLRYGDIIRVLFSVTHVADIKGSYTFFIRRAPSRQRVQTGTKFRKNLGEPFGESYDLAISPACLWIRFYFQTAPLPHLLSPSLSFSFPRSLSRPVTHWFSAELSCS